LPNQRNAARRSGDAWSVLGLPPIGHQPATSQTFFRVLQSYILVSVFVLVVQSITEISFTEYFPCLLRPWAHHGPWSRELSVFAMSAADTSEHT
jgi:hypothetical protein